MSASALRNGADGVPVLAGLSVLVVGLGVSGRAACQTLARRGARVTATDRREAAVLGDLASLTAIGVGLELGGHREASFGSADLVVVSPGVPGDRPEIAAARAGGVPVWGEIELAWRLHSGRRWIAITGTCGKTTTTLWTGEMLAASGVRAVVAGNVGNPLTGALDDAPADAAVVAEVSSFQLETIHTFRPSVAAVLNLSEDHLDRYGTLDAYRRAKVRVLENQRPDDTCVLHADDPLLEPLRRGARGRLSLFSTAKGGRTLAAWAEAGMLWIRPSDAAAPIELVGVGELRLTGIHSVENALAASLCALAAGASPDGVRTALRGFTGVPHRQEMVAEHAGVRFVNDSQATKIASVRMALLSYPRILLIAGGRDKGAPFERLTPLVAERVRRIYAIGEAADRIEAAWGGAAAVERAGSLEEAVERAAAVAEAGDVVLLAPGCASFDMFRDYKDRGDRFRAAARASIARRAR